MNICEINFDALNEMAEKLKKQSVSSFIDTNEKHGLSPGTLLHQNQEPPKDPNF